MGEAVAIILEYLRRHSFTKAEAALEAEILGRQGFSSSHIFTFKNGVDHEFSSPHEPKKARSYAFSGSVLEDASENLREPLYDEPSDSVLDEDYCKGARLEFSTSEKLTPLGLNANEPEAEVENSVILARDNTTKESKIRIQQTVVKDAVEVGHIEFNNVLLTSKHDNKGQRRLIENHVVQKNANDLGPIEKIISVQNDMEQKDFETQQKDGTFFGSRPCEILATQSDRMKNSRQVEDGSERLEGEMRYSSNVVHQASGSKAAKRWEELDGLSLHEFIENGIMPDIGKQKLEMGIAVQESAHFVRRKPSDEKTPFHISLPLMEFPDNQHRDVGGDCYRVPKENGWFGNEQPKHRSLKSHGKASPVKTRYPSLILYPSEEVSLAQMQQQEQGQTDWMDVHGAKEEKKDPIPRKKECLQEAFLPWEANFSNEAGILGRFEDKNATSERTCKEVTELHHRQIHAMGKSSNWYQDNAISFNFASTSDDPFHGDVRLEPFFELGSYLDVQMGQDFTSSGNKLASESCYPSVSQGIVEDTPELLSGFATLKDGANESGTEYPQEYWESDGYDDDDDPGYHRQPIEDEAWFLAHEIKYPSVDERAKCNSLSKNDLQKPDDDENSFMEEESYFSGEQLYRLDQSEPRVTLDNRDCTDSSTDFNERSNGNHIVEFNQLGSGNYDYQLMDDGHLKLVRPEPIWQGFICEDNQLGCEKVMPELNRWHEEASLDVDDDRQGSIRSGGVGMGSDVADYGSELRDSLLGGSSEGDFENLRDREMVNYMVAERRPRRDKYIHKQTVPGHSASGLTVNTPNDADSGFRCFSKGWEQGCGFERQFVQGTDYTFTEENSGQLREDERISGFGGFSFPSSSSTGDMLGPNDDMGKLIILGEDKDSHDKVVIGPDGTLASWKHKSNESSPILSPRKGAIMNHMLHSSQYPRSSDSYSSRGARGGTEMVGDNNDANDGKAVVLDDEETAAVQDQIRRIKAEEDEYEVFNLRIIHRRNRTGFEEDKNFPVVINSVIAGRYHVTEYLGSAAFSKAIQAHDLHTGQDVCMKIIKNNKDFFDQSLDEIKLLKYINRHDPTDKYHVLRLYDYFYFCEHLFIVCELLRANLYEFHKFNRESGAEAYFTMPRLQSIARQCLEALEFLHSLGLIHCDLKPENILVKSYSRCEVKVIDFGSSCFQTDHLCPYVQSRSYRAPEVILGLSYNQKIDIWSLGCILAELCSGNVLFQNDSLATLLARIVGIIGHIDPEMMTKGRDVHKYFTKNHMLYERNPETNQLEYLLPKKTSLRHRLPVGDQGFVDFVGYLLQINPENRPSATEALKHPWLSHPYEPISS